MLSRLALSSSVLSNALKPQASARILFGVRNYSAVSKIPDADLKETIANWDRANEMYYGPHRDYERFPSAVNPEKEPNTRLGFIPESFFLSFYDKTGFTGPYVLLGGFSVMCFSKEYMVDGHFVSEFASFWLLMAFIYYKFGTRIGNYCDRWQNALKAYHWDEPHRITKLNAAQMIETLKKRNWSDEGKKYLFEASRENIDFQLEAIYRQRLSEVQSAVKKRLDYQVDKESTKRRVEHEHMVSWIVDSVVKGITPKQEKDSITKCIGDLKALAAKQ